MLWIMTGFHFVYEANKSSFADIIVIISQPWLLYVDLQSNNLHDNSPLQDCRLRGWLVKLNSKFPSLEIHVFIVQTIDVWNGKN